MSSIVGKSPQKLKHSNISFHESEFRRFNSGMFFCKLLSWNISVKSSRNLCLDWMFFCFCGLLWKRLQLFEELMDKWEAQRMFVDLWEESSSSEASFPPDSPHFSSSCSSWSKQVLSPVLLVASILDQLLVRWRSVQTPHTLTFTTQNSFIAGKGKYWLLDCGLEPEFGRRSSVCSGTKLSSEMSTCHRTTVGVCVGGDGWPPRRSAAAMAEKPSEIHAWLCCHTRSLSTTSSEKGLRMWGLQKWH